MKELRKIGDLQPGGGAIDPASQLSGDQRLKALEDKVSKLEKKQPANS